MKTLTIFTPTYNRAYCLHLLYESLCNQTNQDFLWLIIDDGSLDNTKEIVEKWQTENKIEIEYIFKPNGGMHTGHNTAYDCIKTEINTCIDSEDDMPVKAVEDILKAYQTIKDNPKIAGLVGLDVFKDGNIVGTKFPENLTSSTLTEIYETHKITGDKKLVLKTEIVNQYPRYPEFTDEKFVPLGILYLMIDQQYQLLCINKPFCVVEYMEDGSTRNIFKQYQRHPKGFRYSRQIELQCYKNTKTHIIKCLHYISSTLFVGDYQFFKNNPKKILTFCLLPIGIIFHFYILFKIKV